jgi:predicted ATPase
VRIVSGTEYTLEKKLVELIRENREKRVIVVGTTCSGKPTMLNKLHDAGLAALDMDRIVFPRLDGADRKAVERTPWTEEIGMLMERLSRKHVVVEPGKPVFGTVVFDCDLIIYLKISDDLLRTRNYLRGARFDDAKGMQLQIEANVKKSGIPTIELEF